MQRVKSDITFKMFWEKYPLHKAKGPAERAWDRLSAKDRRAAYEGIDRYREYCQQTGVSMKYAHGWLNDRRWEDEYDETPADNKKPAPPEEPLNTEMEIW